MRFLNTIFQDYALGNALRAKTSFSWVPLLPGREKVGMRGNSCRKAPLTLALSLKGRGFTGKLCQVHSSLIFFSWLLVVTGASWAQTASPTPTPSETAVPTPSPIPAPFSPEHLKGRTGVGIASLTNIPTAFAYRYWMDDATALDIYLGGTYSQTNSYDFSGGSIQVPTWNYGLSVGLKENFNRPVKDVFVQWIERLSFSETYAEQVYSDVSNGYTYGSQYYYNQNQVVNLFLGVGFEAFVPFWESLSIEGSVGLSSSLSFNEQDTFYNPAFSSSVNTHYASYVLTTGFNSNAFSIFNGAVHFYF